MDYAISSAKLCMNNYSAFVAFMPSFHIPSKNGMSPLQTTPG